ncbi:hypothetical protein AGABI1DRAFT_90245 [Agaricus bisporus var. burnettii JB137-S8]|uniref:Uncharacterized protein n=1 Tax=Agaricus bisporus var. burnettii (strain JB137-S8 / ATCC MYA-4627 / FGSC 10392) TaxID=597362 RepID=K5Y242_AGABU|nr:uncharacterized protein AGABI1DRAFT_90245 [Agaricus bisporus var. burnettii JB137-S8]EKM81915.1 hypothetical protein AGABI1DRAFT_90245 [Agaricus bisporus var. burnettii JB137-S8]
MAHGVELLLPFDITEATYLLPPITRKLLQSELLASRSQALEKCDENLAMMHQRVVEARQRSVKAFEKRNINKIKDYNFLPGELVSVLNKRIEPDVGRKCRPRYFGPMVVVCRHGSGAYTLAEVTGVVSKLKFAVFRLVPYHAWSKQEVEVTEFVADEQLETAAGEE